MIAIVNKSQVMLDGTALVGEASTMNLAPGEWPEFVSVIDDQNEGFLFQRSCRMDFGGEFAGYVYLTKGGAKLTVWND